MKRGTSSEAEIPFVTDEALTSSTTDSATTGVVDSEGEKIHTEWREKNGTLEDRWVGFKGLAKHALLDEDLVAFDIINRETINKCRRVV
ncbi:predicted protein [Botrytis cinerea T4]|uniref:Uncharacterized protein n=1 Tax=Botryotinia fuckeliana (strain T4) TaxID=999810 RepID=G2Y8C8_BOTF4|nr:predicted protein [Botrytis cinerea T4]